MTVEGARSCRTYGPTSSRPCATATLRRRCSGCRPRSAAEPKAAHRGEDGPIQHAELRLGDGLVMFGQHSEGGWMGGEAPRPLASTGSVYVVIADPDGHGARARAAGAKIVRELV